MKGTGYSKQSILEGMNSEENCNFEGGTRRQIVIRQAKRAVEFKGRICGAREQGFLATNWCPEGGGGFKGQRERGLVIKVEVQ